MSQMITGLPKKSIYIVGVTRIDRVRDADVRDAMRQEEVIERVKRKQRAWKRSWSR